MKRICEMTWLAVSIVFLTCINMGAFAQKPTERHEALLTPAQTATVKYCDDYVGDGVGSGNEKLIRCGIMLPQQLTEAFEGNTITKIEIALSGSASKLVPVITTANSSKNQAEQTAKAGKKGWNTLTLDKPFTIGKEALIVGYECVGTYVAALSNCHTLYGNYISQGGAWEDYSAMGWGAFCIRVTVQGNDLPMAVMLETEDAVQTSIGQDFEVSATVMNFSPSVLESFDIEGIIDGKQVMKESRTMSLGKGNQTSLKLKAKAPASSGIYQMLLALKQANGTDVEQAVGQAAVTVTVPGKVYGRKVVVEEGTGTWCGWCVRGYVGMAKMAEQFPDDFIGIAIHSGDKMDGAQNYGEVLNYFSGFPSCVVNRNKAWIIDPNEQSLKDAILKLKDGALATISAKMYVDDEDTTKVNILTDTEFGLSLKDAPFRIAYAVVENHVGPYAQANYYSGSSNKMDGFEKKGEYVPLEFNDVARGIYGSYNGVEGSIPAVVEAGKSYTNLYTLALPKNIDSKANVEVVALLLNTQSGEIINAYRCGYEKDELDYQPNAITTLHPTLQPQEEYSLNGMAVSKNQRGLHIVRMADGSVRKIMR